MTLANSASQVKLCETVHIPVHFITRPRRGTEAKFNLLKGAYMFTLIDEQVKPEFVLILHTFCILSKLQLV